MFIDKANITVKAGNGGDGSMAFRREKFVPRGGPNGGDGGQGGDVYFQANPRLRTLLDFVRKTKFQAPNGNSGSGYHRSGSSGEDLVLEVPCGTSLYQGPRLLADLMFPGERILVAKGGRGGRGNDHFKSSVRRAPRIAEKGEPGESVELQLQMKMIADVGLVGCPNAGKSTLLSRLTRANPKIANYPFTTLHPNLGVAAYHEREVVFADIPGLIEGSHDGRGLGHEFLRHVERTRILLHIVDPLGFNSKSAAENIKIILSELKAHSRELFKKPQIIVVNKQDLAEGEPVYRSLKKSLKTKKVLAVSGVSGHGIPELLAEVARILDTIPEEEPKPMERPVHIRLDPEFWVEKLGLQYVVKGKKVERLVAMTNFRFPEAVERTQNILKKMGVERELRDHGAQTGDPVRISHMEFTFDPKPGFAAERFRRKARRKKVAL